MSIITNIIIDTTIVIIIEAAGEGKMDDRLLLPTAVHDSLFSSRNDTHHPDCHCKASVPCTCGISQ